MRRIISLILLSLFISTGSNVALADRHDHRRDNREWKSDRHHDKDRRHKEKQRYKKDRHDKRYKHHDRDRGPVIRIYSDYREPRHYRKPKPHKRYCYGYPAILPRMVAYAARGGRDVNVWQIDDDTYVVRYNCGGRYYTQRLYPNSKRYGARGLVNINWSPESYWLPLPSININIPFD